MFIPMITVGLFYREDPQITLMQIYVKWKRLIGECDFWLLIKNLFTFDFLIKDPSCME